MADKRQRLIYEIVVQGAGQLTADLKTIQDLLNAQTKTAQESGKAIVDAISKENQAVADLIRQQNELQRTAQATRQAQLESTKEATKAAQEAREAAKAQAQAIKEQNAQYGAMKDQLSGLVGLAASVFSINAIKNYASDVIDAKTKVDLFSVSLTSMLGNKKVADEIAGQVFEIAKKSPFEVEQLINVTQRLKAMGVETDNLIPYIKALGDISAYVGTSKLPFMAKAMVDVQNKGKLMQQEINQFTNAGVPLFDLLAKSMNKPREAVIELAHAHQISFAQVERAILQATEKGGAYYKGMENSAKTLGGQVSNLSDLFFLGKAKVGDYFENGLQKGITIMGDFLKATLGSNSAITRTVTTLEGALALWLSYKVAVIATNASLAANQQATLSSMGTQLTANTVTAVGTGLTTSLSTAFKGLWLAMSANPIGFVVSALGLAFSAFQLYEASVMKVTAAESEELNMLNKTKAGFEANVKALINLKQGSEERVAQVAKLQAQYPGYIRNIDLESASNNQLFGLLKKVNTEIERKIKLAIQDSYTQSIQEKAIELGREQLKIINSLRENNKAYINDSNLSNEEFLAKLKAQNATMSDRSGLNTMNRLGIETLANTQKEMNKLTGQMAQSINQTTKITKDNLQASQKDLLEDLAYQQKILNDKYKKEQDLAKGNKSKLAKIESDYKKEWNEGIDQYKADYKTLLGDKVKDHSLSASQIESIEETTGVRTAARRKKEREAQYKLDVQAVQDKYKNDVDGEKKITDAIIVLNRQREKDIEAIEESGRKKKKENHSATAKEINLIEAQANAKRLDMSKVLAKDEIKVLEDLAKAEYAVEVEKVNKKYKAVKDGKDKISAEIIKLDQILFDKLEKIEFDETKKRFAGVELLQNKHLNTKELNQKVSLDKQQKSEEKLNKKLEELTKDYNESEQKLNDARRLQDELANAKTASQKYAVMLKYGKRTSDELLALSVERWRAEQAQLLIALKYAEVVYGKDSLQYKTAQEKNLELSTKINNAMTTVITKQADETLRTYGKLYAFYQKHLADSFKLFDESYKNIQEVFKKSKDQELSDLQNSLDRQLKLAGDNFQERIRLTEEYAKKEVEILTNANNRDRIIGNLRDITAAIGSAFEKQSKIYENYQTKTAENAKNGISNAGNTAMSIMQSVGATVTEILGVSQKARDREFQYQTDINDATQKNYKKLYDEKVNMATQTHNKAIALIKEEERVEIESLQIRLAKELEILAIKYNQKFALLDENKNRELKIHEINNAEYQKLVDKRAKDEIDKLTELSNATLDETKQKLDTELAEKLRYVELADKLKQDDFDRIKFWYDKEIEAAEDNEEKKKQLTDQYQKDIADAEKYWSEYKIKAQKDADDAKKVNAEAVAQAEKDAKVKFEKDKAQIVLKTEAELEAERLVKIEERRLHDITVEDQKNKEALEILEKAKKDAIGKEKEYWMQASENRRIQYEKDLLAAGTDDEAKKKLTEQYLLDNQDLEDKAKLAIEFREKQHNKIIEEEMQRHTDDKRIIEYKYDQWVIDKKKQYEDERQEIIEKAEKKRTETLALAEQERVIATNIANQAKEIVISNSNDKILEADYLYQQALFEGEKEYIRQSLQLQLERNEQQAEYNKATITSNLWVGASNAVANGNVVGGLLGAFNALLNGSDYTNEIEGRRAEARNSINAQIRANNSRQAPNKVTNTRKVVYNRGVELEDANLYTDFLTNPLAAQGHETPIDYINGRGVRLAVYEWIPIQQGDNTVYNPRLRRNFKDGSNYVERGSFPQGIDTIPAMLNEGEKVFTTEQSQQLGGKSKPNEQIVKEVKFAEFVMAKMPNMMNMIDLPRLKMDNGRDGYNDERVIKALKSVEEVLKNKKTSNVNINVDKYKIDVQEHEENSKINYHNQIYNRNRNN